MDTTTKCYCLVISAPAAQPGVIVTTTPGYNYDVPEVTLPVRPQTTRKKAVKCGLWGKEGVGLTILKGQT